MKQNVPDNNERWTLPTHHRDLGTTHTRLISDIPYITQQIILKYISLGGMLGGLSSLIIGCSVIPRINA